MATPQQKLITVVTATFNRAHLLIDQHDSLCHQSNLLFDCIVVDEESTDDAIAFLTNAAQEVEESVEIAGVASLRGHDLSTPLDKPSFPKNTYVVASNLERKQYQLKQDACEVYKTAVLASHPFQVWKTEKFVTEQVVWNQLALKGYRLRWYNRITVVARYQASGMTNASWGMLKNNPMGYVMMFNHLLLTTPSFRSKINNTIQFISCCFLGNNPSYIFNCNQGLLGILLFIPGWALSKRRRIQFKHFSK